MPYVATINVPGYLPESEPVEFDTAQEAWRHLADERQLAEDDAQPDAEGPYSATYDDLLDRAVQSTYQGPVIDTVYGPTPGYEGDHDLGLAYSVEYTDEPVPQD